MKLLHCRHSFFSSLLFSVSADTTDVQYANVHYENNQTVAVTCYFAEGSQALGCHVKLRFLNDYQALNIYRVDRSFIACQEIETHFPAHCYQSQLYVYDWEADGTVGTLPVPVETMLSEGALIGSLWNGFWWYYKHYPLKPRCVPVPLCTWVA